MPSEESRGERLHPISLFFGVGTTVWAILVFLLATGASSCIVVFFLPNIVASIAKYVSFRYWLGPDEMVIREGILRRNERHIPYARIQNIDLIQNPLHRLFKVAVVRLETASGGKPEAVISVLTLSTIEDMRTLVFQERRAGEAAGGEQASTGGGPRPLLELPLKELAIFGAISNKGMVMVAAALGIAIQIVSQTGYLESYLEDPTRLPMVPEDAAVPEIPVLEIPVLEVEMPEFAMPASLLTAALWAGGGMIALLLALKLLSVLWAILKFYAFRLDRRGDDLRARYGLLTKVTATIPRHRIQLVTVHLSPLHRLFGRAAVQVDTAGGGGGGADQNQQGAAKERQWLAPVIRRLKVLDLLRSVMPESRLEQFDWRPISPRAWKRLFRRWLVLLLLLAALGFASLGVLGPAIVALGLPLAFVHARLYVQRTGYALTPAAVLYRSGCWVRRVSIVPFGKIQVLGLRQTPFDRRNAMASVHVDTAGANLGGHRVAISYLDTETAREVLHRLDDETARTSFKW